MSYGQQQPHPSGVNPGHNQHSQQMSNNDPSIRYDYNPSPYAQQEYATEDFRSNPYQPNQRTVVSHKYSANPGSITNRIDNRGTSIPVVPAINKDANALMPPG